jgi:hypothetical protein
MDFIALYNSFGKGRKAETNRADYWRQYEPYCFLIDEDAQVAYPINRFYKQLGQPRETKYICYPHYTHMLYVYRDGIQPFFSKQNCIEYNRVIDDIHKTYKVEMFDEKQLARSNDIRN